MRKRIILFLTVLAIFTCLFAISVSASDIYSDYTKAGENGEAPIFIFLGYSTSDDGGIGVGYTVNKEALARHEEEIGEKLNYGLVVTLKGYIDGTAPLNCDGSIPLGKEDRIIVANFDKSFDKITAKICGIPSDEQNSQVVLSLFVVENDGVKYIGSEQSSLGPESISYNEAREGKDANPAVPPLTEVTINGMTYSINGVTEPAWDRIRQQNASNSDYNTGSSLTNSQLTGLFGVKNKALLIAAGGSLINMPAASALMSHYLKNTGEAYNIDVAGFLSDDTGALASRNKAINNALRAAEALAQEGKTLTINQLAEGHPMQGSLATQNWQYAIGSYFDDVDVINLTVTEVDGVKTYSADIKYIVTDFYNWDTNDYNEFKGIVSPHDLHELHKAGIAKEFMSYGEITYSSITWTEGQAVDQIVGLN